MTEYLERDKLAARSAIACWFGKEGQLALAIQSGNPIGHELIDRWLASWRISRNSPKASRERLYLFLNTVAKPLLIDTQLVGLTAYMLVEQLSEEAYKESVTPGRLTSLISKFAFSCRPEIFVPYDRLARAALRKLGHKIPDHRYLLYMEAFNAEKKKVTGRLRDENITASTLLHRGRTMPNNLFEMRACDKSLMLLGGFSPETMAREFDLEDFNADFSAASMP